MTQPAAPLEFEEFYEVHHGRLAAALYLLTASRSEAEDLAQEAMARVFERWDRVRTMASPDGYAYRAALYLHRSRLRRLMAGRRREAAEVLGSDPLAVAEARMEVHRAMQSLTRQQREAVVLVDWLGMTTEEAGKMLGIAAGTLRTRLHRARPILRARLEGPDA